MASNEGQVALNIMEVNKTGVTSVFDDVTSVFLDVVAECLKGCDLFHNVCSFEHEKMFSLA